MSFNTSFSVEWILRTHNVPLNETGSRYNGNIKVKIYPIWYKQITVEWSVPASFGNCVFNVYFCTGENGPYEKINKTPISATFFKDTSTEEFSKHDQGWYIVEAELLDKNNLKLRSNPTSWATYQRNWVGIRAQEINRREYWLLSKFTGVKSYLFRKKSYGKRCTLCYDTVKEQVTNDHCPSCLGTSFEGGYFEPTLFYAQYETTPNEKVRTYYGISEPNQIGAWTISVPEINDLDVIVRVGDWKAYRVEKITPTELQANPVRQLVLLSELSKGDVEYQLIKRQLPEMPTEYTV